VITAPDLRSGGSTLLLRTLFLLMMRFFVFLKNLAAMWDNNGVDLGEALFGEEGEVFLQGGEGKFEGHVEGGLAEELAHEGVVVGDVVEAVVVAVERKTAAADKRKQSLISFRITSFWERDPPPSDRNSPSLEKKLSGKF
jgi:hypothetical protein